MVVSLLSAGMKTDASFLSLCPVSVNAHLVPVWLPARPRHSNILATSGRQHCPHRSCACSAASSHRWLHSKHISLAHAKLPRRGLHCTSVRASTRSAHPARSALCIGQERHDADGDATTTPPRPTGACCGSLQKWVLTRGSATSLHSCAAALPCATTATAAATAVTTIMLLLLPGYVTCSL